MNQQQQRELLKIARKNGATIVNGKHIKVYAPDGRYICSFSHGGSGFEGRHDGQWYLGLFRKEGWV